MSDYLPQNLYILKIGKAYVYPYGDQYPHLKDRLDTSVMANKEKLEKLQERFGGTIFRVYIKELEPEEPEEESERSCKNCIFAEFAVSGLPLYCEKSGHNITTGEACDIWKGDTNGN